MKRVAILQSNYIPWKGYFDLIAFVDEFIIYDSAQYTRRDWRNRNQIKTSQGLQWLSVPVKAKGRYFQAIRDTEIDGTSWIQTHWKSLQQNYRRSPCFEEISALLANLYLCEEHQFLSVLNRKLLETICGYLGIRTKITDCRDYEIVDGKTERLLSLCQQVGATEYVSGPAARCYIDESLFRNAGIGLTWFDYANYPEYPQLWGRFSHNVTILDLLFNCGKDSPCFTKHVQR